MFSFVFANPLFLTNFNLNQLVSPIKKIYKLRFTSCLIFLLLISFQSFSYSFKSDKKIDSLRIKETQLLGNKAIKLNDNWEFYWKEFINPGEFTGKTPLDIVQLKSWTNFTNKETENLPSCGYATYRKTFSIPDKRPNVSLYIPRIIGAYKIWINGDFILETGKIGTSKDKTLHRRFTKIIPLELEQSTFEIVIQVSNFYNKKGGIAEPILIGRTEELLQKKFLQTMTDMFTIGSFSFIGILFLFFYFVYWNKDRVILYFSVMCIALAYHTLNDRYAPLVKVFDEISWVLLTKIEYIASYLVGLTGSLFFAIILKDYIHKWYMKAVVYCTVLLILTVIFLPAPYFTEVILYFLIFMLIDILYVIFITLKAIISKSKESLLLLIGIVIGGSVFLSYIIFFINENETGLIFVKFGYILVFLFISMLLMRRFSMSFRQLEEANVLATKQKLEISNQSKELTRINSQLSKNLLLLENNNRELEDFNHIVSHDLKTPLVSVYSLASFIEEDLKDAIESETKSHIKMMKDVISNMEASINGLLEYSKVAKGRKSKQWFFVNKTLLSIIEVIDTQKENIFDLPKEDIKIFANKVEFEHVFQNLITNSIKYNDKEQTVVKIRIKSDNNEYKFSLSDNGPGIEPQYHKQIFNIFSQLDHNSDDLKSTGIGLAIVKKIIANNNGEISVDSKKGEGLTISFTWKIDSDTQ